jgi:thymine-DNA glycosylase
MEIRNGKNVESPPLATGTNDTNDLPRRSFKNHVSKFSYSSSSPANHVPPRKTDSFQPQTPSPALKRKRSQASSLKSTLDLKLSQSPTQKAEPRTPRRRSTPRSRKVSSTSVSPSSPATPVVSNLRDSLRPNLTLVLIGLNPGITTASLGHPYSHPSNGFWKILYSSGITTVQHRPQDHPLLPDLYGIGNTNICARPSRRGSELTKAELAEGAKILDEKMALYRPEAACISGKGVWEALWCYKTGKKRMPKEGDGSFRYGWQDEELWLGRVVDEESGELVWKGTKTFVAPSTSGLNAGMRPAEKEEAWRPIGEWMSKKREESGVKNGAVKTEEDLRDATVVVANASADLDPLYNDKTWIRPGNMYHQQRECSEDRENFGTDPCYIIPSSSSGVLPCPNYLWVISNYQLL